VNLDALSSTPTWSIWGEVVKTGTVDVIECNYIFKGIENKKEGRMAQTH